LTQFEVGFYDINGNYQEQEEIGSEEEKGPGREIGAALVEGCFSLQGRKRRIWCPSNCETQDQGAKRETEGPRHRP
jgi:hypothetical protein